MQHFSTAAIRNDPHESFDCLKKVLRRKSLEIQWLGLGAFTAVTQVQSRVRELKFCSCAVLTKNLFVTFHKIIMVFGFLDCKIMIIVVV